MPIEKLDKNKPLPVAGRSSYQIGYDRNSLNQPGQQKDTRAALLEAVQDGKQVTLDVVKSRLLRGENNAFSVQLLMELAQQLMTQKQASNLNTASDDPICAPV